jgi:hypothetical protein
MVFLTSEKARGKRVNDALRIVALSLTVQKSSPEGKTLQGRSCFWVSEVIRSALDESPQAAFASSTSETFSSPACST